MDKITVTRRITFSRTSFQVFILLVIFSMIFSLSKLPVLISKAGTSVSQLTQVTNAQISQTYGKIPLSFEKNLGQTDESVKFLARGKGYSLFLTDKGATLQLSSDKHTSSVVTMQLLGGQAPSAITGVEELPGKVNYFIGDQSQWKTNVSTYEKVHYNSVYPGIDLAYYGNQGQLEYDFIVKPGANPSDIAFSFAGADKLEISAAGNLLLHLGGEIIILNKPVVYQNTNSTRQKVPGNFVITQDQAVKFDIGSYDKNQELVIDPTFVFAGYVGGNGNDSSGGVALDSAGNIYITGQAGSGSSFPTVVGPDTSFNGGMFGDVFVAKIKADGSGFDYIGFIGGSGTEGSSGITVDNDGSAYIVGGTDSSEAQGFPVFVGPDLTYNGYYDGFVAKLSPDGSTLEYAGYIGGSDQDVGGGNTVAVDSDENFYLTGYTYSSAAEGFPVSGGPDLTYNGDQDAFVAKVTADGTGLVYAGYIGGSDQEGVGGLAIDTARNVYVSGSTHSNESTFPLIIGPDLTFNGNADAFISKIDSSGMGFVYSGYIGGTGQDVAQGIAVNSGNAYLTGFTHSSPGQGFPVVVGPNLIGNGNDNQNAFVAKVKTDGSGLDYLGYIGGDGSEGAYGIALDTTGNAYIAGNTSSTETMGFPATVGPDVTYNGGLLDGFVAKVKADGTQLVYASYIGGSGEDVAGELAVDSAGNLYVVGNAASSELTFPVQNVGPDLATHKGGNYQGYDTFIIKISGNQPPIVGIITAPASPVQVGATVNTSAAFTDADTTDTHTAIWDWGDGNTSACPPNSTNCTLSETNGSGTVTGSHTYITPGVYEVKVTVTDDDQVSGESVYQYVVVYDNNTNSGFVTGAGTINSPEGAYVSVSSFTGIARFGFVSKYQPGAGIPTGDTQFRFQTAGFTFSSTSYQWLVVAGAQAKFKGLGTVNGTGNYGFQLFATDGVINGGGGTDKFRIKIWDKDNNDTVVYDNNLGSSENEDPTTEITGGNIIIHH